MKSFIVILSVLVIYASSIKIPISSQNRQIQASQNTLTLNYIQNATDREAICNDGTDGVFWFSKGSGSGSNRWLVHLEGGWWCWDVNSCNDRWKNSVYLMTSNNMPKSINKDGIFSSDPNVNPDFYNANLVYVHYCSSDTWSGDADKSDNGQWYFKGQKLIKAVIEDLTNDFGLNQAKEVVFSGCSAGGQGVVVNADYVESLLPSGVTYGALADAGWMQNILPFHNVTSIYDQVTSGYKYWKGQVDSSCAKSNPGNEWMCYISPYAVPHIQVRILVQAEQYDSFQVPYDCCSPPFSSSDWTNVEIIRTAFATSMAEVRPPSSVYSAACYTHCLTEDSQFYTVAAKGYTLKDVFGNWFFSREGPTFLIDDCQGFKCSQNCP